MRFSSFTRPQAFFLMLITFLKAIIMTLTPLNLDLSFVVSRIDQTSGLTMTPYGALLKMIVGIWLLVPVDHPVLASAWSIDSFNPSFGIYVLVFMIKLPLLILDLFTGLLLYFIAVRPELGLTEKKARRVFFLWFLNPYVFLVNEMAGAVDIYPAFVLILAFALIAARKHVPSACAYAASVALKLLPFMLLPALAALEKRNRQRLLILFCGVVGVGIYVAWLLRSGYDPLSILLQYDPFTQNLDEYAVLTGAKTGLGLMSATLAISYVLVALKWKSDLGGLLDASLLVLLVYFSFGNWFPQLLIWIIPFLTLDYVRCQRVTWSRVFFATFVVSALAVVLLGFPSHFTSNGTALLFVPAANTILKVYASDYASFAQSDFVQNVVEPVVRSLFLSTCVIYCVELAKRNGFFQAISRLY